MIVLKKRFSHRGVTLPELLLAAFFLAFVISGMLLILTHCIMLNEANRNLTHASSRAQFIMEDIITYFRDSGLENTKQKIDQGLWNWDQEMLEEQGLIVLTSENIVVQADEDGGGLAIAVVVTWQDRNQREREFSLKTMWREL